MIFLLFVGCTPLPETVTMTGTVWDAPYGEGSTVGGATLEVLDAGHEAYGSATADDDGAFSVDLPAGVTFYLNVSAEDHVATAFSGTAGISDLVAPEGYPWVATQSFVDDLAETFAGCPTAADAGAVIAGEIVAGNYSNYPVVETGTARAYDPDGNEYAACYLDDDGVYSADATQVGETGEFVIFGVPAGGVVVDVRYSDGSGSDPVQLFELDAPEDGLVPLYPALIQVF